MFANHFVFFTIATEGGAWNRQLELLEHLSLGGNRCCLIAPACGNLSKLYHNKRIQIVPINFNPKTESSITFARRALPSVLRQIKQHTENTWFGSFAGNGGLILPAVRSFLKFYGRKGYTFCVLRGVELESSVSESLRKKETAQLRYIRTHTAKFLLRRILRASDLLITQSEPGLRNLKEQFEGYIPEQTAVLPNNWNIRWVLTWLRELENEPALKSESYFRVCFSGRIQTWTKGIDYLFNLVKSVEEFPVIFDIVGLGPDFERVKRMAVEMGLNGRVKFHGWLENPLRIVRSCDMVIVPSRFDACPNVILEAFACGKPVLGSKVAGIEALLKNEELLFPVGDVATMKKKVVQAACDPLYLRHLTILCKQRKKEFKFDWGKRFESILENAEKGILAKKLN